MTDRAPVALLAPSLGAEDRQRLEALLGGDASAWRMRTLSSLATAEMLRVLAEERAAELVVQRTGDWLDSTAAGRLLAHWRMPVIVTGGAAD